MNRVSLAIVAACGVFAAQGASAQTGELRVPGVAIRAFDITWVDQASQRVFLADRTDAGIDVWDARTHKYITTVTGMVGNLPAPPGQPTNVHAGPNGVTTGDGQAIVGDGDSKAKFIDLDTMRITAEVSTGGTARADELDFDPKDHVVLIGNGDDDTPFYTVISTEPGHRIIGKVQVPNGTDGLEQSAYNPADGMFYVSIPEINGNGRTGEVLIVDPTSAKIVKILPTDGCHANGLVFGPNQNFLLGCTAHGAEGLDAQMQIFNAGTGGLVATVPGVGGVDEIAYNKKNNQYYGASANGPAGRTLIVINAATNKLVANIPTIWGYGSMKSGSPPHSVASSNVTGEVFVPVSAAEGGCGCVKVFSGPL